MQNALENAKVKRLGSSCKIPRKMSKWRDWGYSCKKKRNFVKICKTKQKIGINKQKGIGGPEMQKIKWIEEKKENSDSN